jgi:NAD(P)-dependent dehydrogenase (short-subunit alcohol dehydrogenase family)
MFDLKDIPNLTGRVFIVTGGNTGIGYATCAHLAAHGARVYMAARSSEKATAALGDIKASYPNADIRYLLLDLGSLRSVASAAETFKAQESCLHGLINNAGIMGTDFIITNDGNEEQWQTNYLGHWLLTRKLLPILISTASMHPNVPGMVRIVNVSSSGHKLYPPKEGIKFSDTSLKDAGKMTRYGQSKLANVLHSKNLNDLYGPESTHAANSKTAIWSASLDPGPVDTQLNTKVTIKGTSWLHPILKCAGVYSTIEQGATSSLFCASSTDFQERMSGEYFNSKASVTPPSKLAVDVSLRKKLEVWTEEKMRNEGWIGNEE